MIVFAVLLAVCCQGSAAEVRTWTSAEGNTIEAELITASDKEVTIRRVSDGRRFSLPLERLSEADRDWVASFAFSKPLPPAEVAKLTEIPKDSDGIIRLPLRVYIITDIELEQKGVRMSSWVAPMDIDRVVLPEINRIWKAAGIEWSIESVLEQAAADVANREEAITYIQNAKRDAAGKSDPKRMPLIHAFCDKENRHPAIHNLYFFPYLGQTSQGNARNRGNFAVIGVWTDKPSRAFRPPEKFILVEEAPFKIGSIGRTCAHELGHNLGLVHPDSATQTQFGRLMGGRKPGCDLTPEEVKLARETGIKRAEEVLQWVSEQGAN